MVTTVVLVVLAWLALTGMGWLLLAPLRRSARDLLLPAAPLFGVILLVVVLHDTTLVMSVRRAVWVVAVVLVVLGVVATRRDRTWWRPARGAVAVLAITAACGVVPAVWALGPSLAVGDSAVIQPSSNNDAFYYVTVSDWLQDHRGTDVPQIGSTPEGPGVPPSYSSARAQLTLHLRIGQELTQSALTTLLGSDEERTWYPLTALWVLLMPASGVAAARFLRLHVATGLALGLSISVSSVVVFQLASQNSDSLLGTALAPLAIGAVLRAVGRDPLIPPVLAGAALTALVGTYTEITPLIAPALVVAVLARRPRELGPSLGSAVAVLVAAVVIAPWVWIRAVRSLLFLGGIASDTFPSMFDGAPLTVILGRFMGVSGPGATQVSYLALALSLLFAGVGIASALLLSGRRWCYLALLVPGVLLAFYLVTVRERPYTQQRVVQLLVPLVLLVVAAGWDALARRSSRRQEICRQAQGRRVRRRTTSTARGRPVAIAGIGVIGALGLIVANSVVDHDMDLPAQARTRHVGPEFAEAAGWIGEVGGHDGVDVNVLVGDFFSQLWVTDALRDEPDVAYPSLYVSYQGQPGYWNGQPRRYLLTDRRVIRRVGPGVIVERNSRFALLDLSKGRAVVAVPADVFGQNSFVVLRSTSGPEVVGIEGTTRARVSTDVPASPGYGDVVRLPPASVGSTTIGLDLSDSVAERIVLSDKDEVFSLIGVKFGTGG